MIYLRNKNLLFLKPFKVAGTSFEIALSKFAEAEDIISDLRKDEPIRDALGFHGRRNYRYTIKEWLQMPLMRKAGLLYYKHRRLKYRQHTSAAAARDHLGFAQFDQAFKVSIVRNPFDYLISHYFHTKRNDSGPRTPHDFDQWLRENPWVLARNDVFYFVENKDVINHYIRYENFEDDIRTLESLRPELTGLFNVFSGISAKVGVRPQRASVESFFQGNPELISTVRFFYKAQLERFNYDIPVA